MTLIVELIRVFTKTLVASLLISEVLHVIATPPKKKSNLRLQILNKL